jgi:hypothetical protein
MKKELARQFADLQLRAAATPLTLTENKTVTPSSKVDTASEGSSVNYDTAATDFSYGAIDKRGLQPGEHKVKIRQGVATVDVYYNPSNRECRPVYKQT